MRIEIILIFILLLVFPFGQLTKIPINYPEVNIYFHDLIIGLILVSFGIRKIVKKEPFVFPKIGKNIFIFIFLLLFSWAIGLPHCQTREAVVGFLYWLRFFGITAITFVLADLLKDKKFNYLKNKIYDLMIIVGTTASFLGILQYIFIPSIKDLTAFEWDPHIYRVVGTYLDPGFSGLIFVLTIILIAVKPKINLFLFGINYISLALTYSRSSFLAYILGMSVIAWSKKSLKLFLTILTVGIVTIMILPRPKSEASKLQRTSTFYSRTESWRQAIIIGFDQPLFGVGFNNYRYVKRDYGFLAKENWQETHAGAGADSSVLFVFAVSGVMGLIAFIILIFKIFKFGFKKRDYCLLASFSAILIHATFNNSFFYAWILIWWWILWAVRESS